MVKAITLTEEDVHLIVTFRKGKQLGIDLTLLGGESFEPAATKDVTKKQVMECFNLVFASVSASTLRATP